jgi:hypothetical protein
VDFHSRGGSLARRLGLCQQFVIEPYQRFGFGLITHLPITHSPAVLVPAGCGFDRDNAARGRAN